MAASANLMKNSLTFSRLLHLRRVWLCGSRSYSNKVREEIAEKEDRNPKVGMSTDGSTVICWHPEPEHPYEHTQPLSYDSVEAREGDIPLQRRLLRQHETQFRQDGPSHVELTRITFTTKHQWFSQRSKKKFKSKHMEIEREGL